MKWCCGSCQMTILMERFFICHTSNISTVYVHRAPLKGLLHLQTLHFIVIVLWSKVVSVFHHADGTVFSKCVNDNVRITIIAWETVAFSWTSNKLVLNGVVTDEPVCVRVWLDLLGTRGFGRSSQHRNIIWTLRGKNASELTTVLFLVIAIWLRFGELWFIVWQ